MPLGQLWAQRVRELMTNGGVLGVSVPMSTHHGALVAGWGSYWATLEWDALHGKRGTFAWPDTLLGLMSDSAYATIFPTARGQRSEVDWAKSRTLLAVEFIRFLANDAYESGNDESFRTNEYATQNRFQLTDAKHCVTFLRPKKDKSALVKLEKFKAYLAERALSDVYADELERQAAQGVRSYPVFAQPGYYLVDVATTTNKGRDVVVRRIVLVDGGNMLNHQKRNQKIGTVIFGKVSHRVSVKELPPYTFFSRSEWEAMNPEHLTREALGMIEGAADAQGLEDDARAFRVALNQLHPPRPQ